MGSVTGGPTYKNKPLFLFTILQPQPMSMERTQEREKEGPFYILLREMLRPGQ